ncbi:hypothetical protein MBLNU230_g2367t1 [Neophaeotheca triangularis]
MASFAEYTQQDMASSDDFTLFPFGGREVWSQPQQYMPPTTQHGQAYQHPTSFESEPSQQLYDQHIPDQYTSGANQAYRQVKSNVPGLYPTYSPSNSVAPSFDSHYPHLSSISDSGASVQSTISSRMASPSMRAQQGYSCNQSGQQHISALPGVDREEFNADTFATTGYEIDNGLATDKGCVGEFATIPTSCPANAGIAMNEDGFSFSLPLTHALPRRSSGRSSTGTFDSGIPMMPTQEMTVGASSQDGRFKSPTAPASFVHSGVRGQNQMSCHPPHSTHAMLALSSANQEVNNSDPVWNENQDPTRPATASPGFPSPFFSQSSGSFVYPLESSYPSLIQPFSPTQYDNSQFPVMQPVQTPQMSLYPQAPSPALSTNSSPRDSHSQWLDPQSPYHWQPHQSYDGSRRRSVSSVHSHNSSESANSLDSNKGLCPITSCGRHFKDLKAHMLTHQNERPEKCPIATCEYHVKGFARKYDKNRHTLTHYKGTMVCGFCPGSGSAAEKSFNRADVFKRHLTSVHGVDQTPPNARKKSPVSGGHKRGAGVAQNVPGVCSTCGVTFIDAQAFYEHLDDCVLRVVQQTDPGEAINERLLTSVADDPDVQATMSRHLLPTTLDYNAPTSFADDNANEDDMDPKCTTDRATRPPRPTLRRNRTSNSINNPHVTTSGGITKPTARGLTRSKNGVPLIAPSNPFNASTSTTSKSNNNKRRKNYPLSWGAAPDAMKMKKRVLCVYDGQRRLWKDDLMLNADHEVRMPLGRGVGDGRAWTTDLDVLTVRRAEGLLGATDEEKGPWVEGNEGVGEEELRALMQ